MTREAVFVGAHADDIELGAAALLEKIVSHDEWRAWIVVMTDDGKHPERRTEALASAAQFGISEDRVLFLGLEDGHLQCNGDTVARLRSALAACHPVELAVTHTAADSHNDHRATREIVVSALRNAVVLQFAVQSSVQDSHFHPTVMVEVPNSVTRARALAEHRSQADRIARADPSRLLQTYGHKSGLVLAEPYEVVIQGGAVKHREVLDLVDDRPARVFWSAVLGTSKVLPVIYGLQLSEAAAFSEFDLDFEQRALSLLRTELTMIQGQPIELSASGGEALGALYEGPAVLVGGPVSNELVRNYYVRFPDISWVVDYDMPGYRNRRVASRSSGQSVPAVVADGYLAQDVGVLAVVPNPCHAGSFVVCAMGAYGPGTAAGLYAACHPGVELAGRVRMAVAQGAGLELPFTVDTIVGGIPLEHGLKVSWL